MNFFPNVPEIGVDDLARALEAGEPLQVLDIRAPFRVATGRIDVASENQFFNIVGSRLLTMQTAADVGLDPERPIAVVCAHGNSSKAATEFLNRLGFRARSVRGGMAAWMLLAVPRELPTPPSLDRLVQLDRIGKGALGYLLVSDGEAIVVDPPRDPSAYLAAARRAGAKIIAVADTHVHADYISGAPALARRLKIPYYLHPADSIYPYDGTPGTLAYTPIENGGTLRVGRARVRAVHTPGHTEGSLTFMVDDALALTGDFIFIDSIGRPDLAGKTEEWTGVLWKSLESAKRDWPDDLMIYPAHYASDRERNPDRTIGAPFGRLRRHNAPLTIATAEAFTQWVRSKAGAFPDAYRTIKAVNVGLVDVGDLEAEELEMGKNECALA